MKFREIGIFLKKCIYLFQRESTCAEEGAEEEGEQSLLSRV